MVDHKLALNLPRSMVHVALKLGRVYVDVWTIQDLGSPLNNLLRWNCNKEKGKCILNFLVACVFPKKDRYGKFFSHELEYYNK